MDGGRMAGRHEEGGMEQASGRALPMALQIRDLSAAVLTLHAALAARLAVAPSDLAALHQLAAGPLSHRELGRRLGLKPASTSAVVDRLVARGHAARRPSEDDSRVTHVLSTDAGRRTARDALREMFGRMTGLESARTPEERETIVAFLAEATTIMRDAAS